MSLKRKKDETAAAAAAGAMKPAPLVFVHAGYWLVYLLLLSVAFAAVQTQVGKRPPSLAPLFPLIALCVAPSLVSFYSFYFLLFPRFLARRRIFALTVSGAAACLVSALTGVLVSLGFFGFGQAIFSDAREFFFLTASLSAVAALHGAAALGIRGFVSWYEETKLKEELARKNFEMEVALIKSQINPHFLFNTINNIDVLIAKDAALASLYLNKLSGILRYMVYETKHERIPLARELDYLEKYIELQKIRTANPDYVGFQITGEANNLEIAPMILFPFVENAFKHTENKKNSSRIRVKVSIEREKLVFECENSYRKNGDDRQDFGGLGNALVRKRLSLTYPEKHSLEISDGAAAGGGDVYRVKLTLYAN